MHTTSAGLRLHTVFEPDGQILIRKGNHRGKTLSSHVRGQTQQDWQARWLQQHEAHPTPMTRWSYEILKHASGKPASSASRVMKLGVALQTRPRKVL